jgi:transcriptional regulator with XRE-family HTH domain
LDVPLGARVKAYRQARNLGLNEAARLCQIAPQKLADAEAGVDSRATTIAAIARGLGVSSDYLLGLVDRVDANVSMLPVVVLPEAPEDEVAGLRQELADTNRRLDTALAAIEAIQVVLSRRRTRGGPS